MNNIDMARHLYAIAKKNPCVNHQDNKLLHDAAQRLLEDDRNLKFLQTANDELKAKLTETQYLLAEREGIQEDEAILDAAAPGEAAEDFFADNEDGYWDDFCS